jgi:hypothetical protein
VVQKCAYCSQYEETHSEKIINAPYSLDSTKYTYTFHIIIIIIIIIVVVIIIIIIIIIIILSQWSS